MWDRRADVFGLAALIHEMLWGRRLTGVGEEAAQSLTAIPGADMDALRLAFARALAEHPGERFTSALEFAGALADAFSRPAAAVPLPAGDFVREADLEPRLPLEPQFEPEEPELEPEEVEHEAAVDLDDDYAAAEKFVILDPAEPAQAADAGDAMDAIVVLDTPETAEAIVADPMLLRMPSAQAELFDSYRPSPDPAGQDEGSRSSMWPLAFALLIGGSAGVCRRFRCRYPRPLGRYARSRADHGRDHCRSAAAGRDERRSPRIHRSPACPVRPPATCRSRRPATRRRSCRAPPRAARRTPAACAPPPQTAPRAAAVQTAETGSLLVRSTPLGARVFVDNRDYGRTPVTVNALARGAHRVRVTRDGYETDERQVTITPAQRAHSITVRLQAERPPQAPPTPAARTPSGAAAPATSGTATTGNGPLIVESRPAGAKVFVDGKLVGTTPLTLPAVPAGDHAVHLDLDGYRRWSSAIRIIPTAKNRVAASLDR